MAPRKGADCLQLTNGDIVLRDLLPSDADDLLRWQMTDTEWKRWDAPWQHSTPPDEALVRARIEERLRTPPADIRTRFEICLTNGAHIGWMSTGHLSGLETRTAIGIDIIKPEDRGDGRGERAFTTYIHYLFSNGLTEVYTQTWSGNLPMVGLAGKCGFTLYERTPGTHEVDGRLYDRLVFRLTPGDFYKRYTFEAPISLRRGMNRSGWALFALMLTAQAAATLLSLAAQALYPSLLGSGDGLLFISAVANYLFAVPIFWLILRRVPMQKAAAHERPSSWQLIRLFVLCIAAAYLGNLITTLLLSLFGWLRGSPVGDLVDVVIGGSSTLATAVYAGVLAPIMEELTFRKLLLERLLPYGERFAIVSTALAFGLFHGNFSQFIYAFLLGLILAYTVVRFGTVKYAILLHMCFNLLGGILMPYVAGSSNPALVAAAGFFVIGMIVWGGLLFFRARGQVTLEAGAMPLSERQKARMRLRSPGWLSSIALSVVLMVYVLFAL